MLVTLFEVVAITLIVLSAPFLFLAIHLEKKSFNDGKCIKCGSRLRHFDTDSQGGRGYKCGKCSYHTWVSYNCVDKNYSK